MKKDNNTALKNTLEDAYPEAEPLQPRAETLDVLHKAMAQRYSRRGKPLLVRFMEYRMPAYQTLALTGILVAVIVWMYARPTVAPLTERIVYVETKPNGESDVGDADARDADGRITDALVQRVVDSVRSELRREAQLTRRSLEGVAKKSMERVTQNVRSTDADMNSSDAEPPSSPLQSNDAGGLENLTQLQYQQRGKSLADDGIGTRFNDTTTSEALR